MTNRKIKGNKVQTNMRAREFWDCSERNICAVWLALLNMGVSKAKIHAIDDEFHDVTIKKFRQDATDKVIDERLERFMQNVGLTKSDIDRATRRFYGRLQRAFCTSESYAIVVDVLQTDFIAMMYQLHSSLGYGKTRLNRVIDYVGGYVGDEKQVVEKELGIRYPDPDTLPDTTSLYEQKRKVKRELSRANIQARNMMKARSTS